MILIQFFALRVILKWGYEFGNQRWVLHETSIVREPIGLRIRYAGKYLQQQPIVSVIWIQFKNDWRNAFGRSFCVKKVHVPPEGFTTDHAIRVSDVEFSDQEQKSVCPITSFVFYHIIHQIIRWLVLAQKWKFKDGSMDLIKEKQNSTRNAPEFVFEKDLNNWT